MEGSLSFTDEKSSLVRAVDYRNGRMEITFKRGDVYIFQEVPFSEVVAMKEAPSRGKYFKANIEKQYNYERKVIQ